LFTDFFEDINETFIKINNIILNLIILNASLLITI